MLESEPTAFFATAAVTSTAVPTTVAPALTAVAPTETERALFHNLKPRADELIAWFDIDLFEGLNSDDVAFITRMFLRRHVYEHNGGEVDERYIKESGDTSVRPKQRIRETNESTSLAANLIETIGRNFKVGFDEIFPPVETPIRHEEHRKQMMRRS